MALVEYFVVLIQLSCFLPLQKITISFCLAEWINCCLKILLRGLVCHSTIPDGLICGFQGLVLQQRSALKQMCSKGLSGTFFICMWAEWAQCSSEKDHGRRLQKLGIAIRRWNSRPQDADRAKNLTRFKKELDVCSGVRNRASCQNKWLPNVLEGVSNLMFWSLCWFLCIGLGYLSSAGSRASSIAGEMQD